MARRVAGEKVNPLESRASQMRVYDVAQLAGADVAGHVALGRLVEGGAGGEPVDGLQAPGSAHASVAHLVGVGLFVALVFRSRAHGPPSC